MQMRVLILAAGLGTRLRPLTNTKPKVLVEVGGRAMLDYSLDLFEQQGFREVLINIHHFAEQLRTHIQNAQKTRKIRLLIQDESDLLLGSGGAIAKAKDWLYAENSTALFWNADGLLFPNFSDMLRCHQAAVRAGALATINLLRHPGIGKIYHPVFCSKDRVVGFGRMDTSVGKDTEQLHFAGAYLLEKAATDLLPPTGTVSDVAKDVWFPLVRKNQFAYYLYQGLYQDLGTPTDVDTGNRRIVAGEFKDFLP